VADALVVHPRDPRRGATTTTAVAAKNPPAAGSAPITPVGSDLWLDEFQQDDVLITLCSFPRT
jgi:hypothetical protein